MYAVVDLDFEQIGSPAKYIFAYDPDFLKSRTLEDGTFQAKIEDLILLTSEHTMISAGLETLEDLVSKIGEELRRRGLPTDDEFDAAIHETKHEEFRRRYNIY